MTRLRHRQHGGAAFTLVELMTAIAVLSVLMVFISVLLSAASKATELSRVRVDADRQARLIFDSMADDFTRMLRRPDVDFHFVKQSGNDTFFMFCENPGYFSSGLTSTTESNVSLIGYRINTLNNPATGTPNAYVDTPYTLEKMAKGLAWDYQSSASTYPLPYLTYDQVASSGSYTPDPASTILGLWPGIDQPTYQDTNFHMLGDSTFRLEFCFLLTDGTYSFVPATNYTAGGIISSNLTANGPPGTSNGYSTYGPGSRWYDTANNRAYICTSAPQTPSNTAVWQSLGMSDVQAVVVAIAILDQTTQRMIGSNASALPNLAAALADPKPTDMTSSPPVLMETTWLTAVNKSTFASSVGLPTAVASQVRVYQRYFYLNNLYNSL